MFRNAAKITARGRTWGTARCKAGGTYSGTARCRGRDTAECTAIVKASGTARHTASGRAIGTDRGTARGIAKSIARLNPSVYRNMFRVKPMVTQGLIFFTVLIQKSEKQWKVLNGCLKNLHTRIP